MSLTHDTSKSTIKSPLLLLPLELRSLIYAHLVPNVFIHNLLFIDGPTRPSSTKFRTDSQPCTPAILRVNKQLYREAIVEFYSHARFQLQLRKVGSAGYAFLGAYHHTWEDPSARGGVFQYVKKLQISIHFSEIGDGLFQRVQQNVGLTKMLNACVMSGKWRVEDVVLDVAANVDFWDLYERESEHVLSEMLQRYLAPLKNVRGLGNVSVERPSGRANARRQAGMSQRQRALLKLISDEVDDIARLMMLPVTV